MHWHVARRNMALGPTPSLYLVGARRLARKLEVLRTPKLRIKREWQPCRGHRQVVQGRPRAAAQLSALLL
jgi:hypothetical protein